MKGVVAASFKINLTIMKCFGFYPLENYPRFYKFYSYFISIILLLPGSLLGFIQLFLKEEKSEVFDLFSYSIIFLAPKYLSLAINGENIRLCITYFDNEIFVSQSLCHMDIVNTCAQISKRNSHVFIFGVVIALFGWCGKLYFRDDLQLPLDVWFPFADMPVLYYCLYLNLTMGALYAGMSCGIIDPLIAGLICHASGQLQVLQENLKLLEGDFILVAGDTIRNSSDMIYKKIIKCIEHYSAILRFVEEYERSFSAAIFYQFTHSVVTICVCCLEISKLQEFDINFMIMVNFLFCLLFQVFFYCYYGTILTEENNGLVDAIYMGNWYDYNQRSKKALIILMERSRKSLGVTAGKILDMSLETFTLILRRSYSLLAVLKNY